MIQLDGRAIARDKRECRAIITIAMIIKNGSPGNGR
jgi:hypothetical protein